MQPDLEQGYLLLADVSGYTGFLADIELEHATGIVGELIQSMLDGLSPPLELAAVEGDAVFVHGPAGVVSRGETFLELIEATYAAFRTRRDVMAARTSCGCGACTRIDSLDLKFVTHFGGFAWQDVGGRRSPVGTDVNLVHRLLKNRIEAETGWRGYALFTDAALASLGIEPAGMHRGVEEYDHLGGVGTATIDLGERLARRRLPAVEPPAAAHWSSRLDLPAAPATVWEWLNDPRLRSRWVGDRIVDVEQLEDGRTGPGTVYHCHHGGSVTDHTIVDWQPFAFFSEEVRPRASMRALLSWRLEPVGGGTRLRLDVDLSAPLPAAVRRGLCRRYATRALEADLARLEQAIVAEPA